MALAFFVVYVVWGSTYLAIRVAVRDIPPAVLAGLRFLMAGTILTVTGIWRGGKLPCGRDWRTLVILAVGLVVVGNGVISWSEQWVPSGEAAFIVSSSALFTAVFGSFGPRGDRPKTIAAVGLSLGFSGTALMLLSRAQLGYSAFWPALALLGSSCAWSASAMYARSVGISTAPLVFSGIEMLTGGAILTTIALGTGGFSKSIWNMQSVGTLAYLTIFGSAVTYSTYNWLIHRARPAQLGTISYVNPAIALLLGWLILNEKLSELTLMGVGIMLAGVILVNFKRGQAHRSTAKRSTRPNL